MAFNMPLPIPLTARAAFSQIYYMHREVGEHVTNHPVIIILSNDVYYFPGRVHMRSDFKGLRRKSIDENSVLVLSTTPGMSILMLFSKHQKVFHAFIIQKYMVLHPDQITNVASSVLNPKLSERKPNSPTQTNCLKATIISYVVNT
jgi:hypothetical protein